MVVCSKCCQNIGGVEKSSSYIIFGSLATFFRCLSVSSSKDTERRPNHIMRSDAAIEGFGYYNLLSGTFNPACLFRNRLRFTVVMNSLPGHNALVFSTREGGAIAIATETGNVTLDNWN